LYIVKLIYVRVFYDDYSGWSLVVPRRVTIKPGDHRFSGITYKPAKALPFKEDGAVEGLLSILPARVKRSFGRALGNLWWKIIN
jgi:hypothetical protein